MNYDDIPTETAHAVLIEFFAWLTARGGTITVTDEKSGRPAEMSRQWMLREFFGAAGYEAVSGRGRASERKGAVCKDA